MKCDKIKTVFKDIIDDDIKEFARINKNSFTRNRKMCYEDFMLLLLGRKGLTTTMELNNFFKDQDRREDIVSKQAFSKQRNNLNPEVFVELNNRYVKRVYEDVPNLKKYKGYILTAIDGSQIEIPNVERLKEEFDCKATGQSKHRTIIRALASGIYDVENNVMIDSIIDSKSTGERALAISNIGNMLKIIQNTDKIITLFDRGYISLELLLLLMESPIKYLFRLPKTSFRREVVSMHGKNDAIVKIKLDADRRYTMKNPILKEKAKILGEITARIVKIVLPTGEIEYLLTNLYDDVEFPTEEIGELYYKRWKIEKAFDVIKNKLNIENISGRKRLFVEQDFYAQMLVFNMVEGIRSEANLELEIKNKTAENKYNQKANMNILIGTFREYFIKIILEKDERKSEKMYSYMMEEMVKSVILDQPGRSNKRKPYSGVNKHRTNIRRNS